MCMEASARVTYSPEWQNLGAPAEATCHISPKTQLRLVVWSVFRHDLVPAQTAGNGPIGTLVFGMDVEETGAETKHSIPHPRVPGG